MTNRAVTAGMLQGLWYDGMSAARTEVEVRVVGRQLALLEIGTGYTLHSLPIAQLRLADDVYPGQPLRLYSLKQPDARLVVADHSLLAALRKVHPGLGRGGFRRKYLGGMSLGRRFVLVGGFTLVCLVGLAASVPYLGEEAAAAMPAQWERAMGEKIAAHITRDTGTCADEPGAEALERLVSHLAVRNGYAPDFVVQVMDAAMVNAFAAPGGQIMLTRGLLRDAENAEEVAAVLAHEIAHSILQHPTRAMGRALGYRLVFATLLGDASSVAGMAGQAGEALLNRSHSREAELEADRIALEILNNAGVDSRGLATFFERRQKARLFSGPRGSDILSTHPSFPARVAQAQVYQREGMAAMAPADWQALQGMCTRP